MNTHLIVNELGTLVFTPYGIAKESKILFDGLDGEYGISFSTAGPPCLLITILSCSKI